MGILQKEFDRIAMASEDDWIAVQSHAVKKPLLPVGKAQKRYLHLSELIRLSERYALPPYTPGKRESWLREVVRAFDASNPYQCTHMDTVAIEKAARAAFTISEDPAAHAMNSTRRWAHASSATRTHTPGTPTAIATTM